MTDTKTKPSTGDTIGQWPPQAHIFKSHGVTASKPKEGDVALCGAKLMGLDLPTATKVCEECLKIAKGKS